MAALLWAIGATLGISLISLIGIITLTLNDLMLKRILHLMVGFSAGALMGGAFLHLIPEAVEKSSMGIVSMSVLAGFSAFFIIERFLHWHHCHDGKCPVHMFTYMNLIGDGVHKFIDGIVIAASFIINVPLGIATTLAVVAHEVPQEITDFGVLIYGGFSKPKALVYNFITATTGVVGAIVGFTISNYTDSFTTILIPFAAGTFIYISASDLIPELHKEVKMKKSLMSFTLFITGIAFMYVVKVVTG